MSVLDVFISPGVAVGCVAGVAAAAGLQWMSPTENLVWAQALIVAVFGAIGLLLDYRTTDREHKR